MVVVMSGLAGAIQDELDRQGRDWAWLSRQTGIAQSAFVKWKNEAGLIPDLRSLALVSVELNIPLRTLIEACGFPVNESADYADREARARALVAAVPQLAVIADEFASLSLDDQDSLLSVVRAFRKDRGGPKNRR